MSATSEKDARTAIDEEAERLRSLGELADESDGTYEDEQGQRLLDFGDQLNTKIEGNKPTGSEIKIRSISLPIKGQIQRGETGAMLVTWRCGEVAFKAKHDGDGREIDNRRHHVVTPISVVPLSDEAANRALGIE